MVADDQRLPFPAGGSGGGGGGGGDDNNYINYNYSYNDNDNDNGNDNGDDGRRLAEYPDQPPPVKKKKTRTRTGCLNCRRKKRKCDEGRPACGGCSRRKERCEWGIKVTFRAENAQTIRRDHPSMKKARRPPLRRQLEILDVTDEVIRDYHFPPGLQDYDSDRGRDRDRDRDPDPDPGPDPDPDTGLSSAGDDATPDDPAATAVTTYDNTDEAKFLDSPVSYSTSTVGGRTASVAGSNTARRTQSLSGPGTASTDQVAAVPGFGALLSPSTQRRDDDDGMDYHLSPASTSQLVTDSAVANLIYLSQGGGVHGHGHYHHHQQQQQQQQQQNHQQQNHQHQHHSSNQQEHPPPTVPGSIPVTTLPVDPLLDAPFDFMDQIFTPEGSYEDGIFLPGSAYHELHSTLRNHLIQEVRSTGPTRPASPASGQNSGQRSADAVSGPSSLSLSSSSSSLSSSASAEAAEETTAAAETISSDHEPPFLPPNEECALWKNWVDEISPWLDKFDNQRHFQHSLPTMARSHDHLRYSMLALSARQLELKDRSRPTDQSLALYQEAIHLLLPRLPTRTTAVIASCVVLCVLEMASCSPKAWRRHLDGCASLMQAVGMNGFVGGVEQALFWCFVRMDVCGALISSVRTLIPVDRWASGLADAGRFLAHNDRGHDTWANYAVYLCARVLNLLAPLAKANPGGLFFDGGGLPTNDAQYRTRWMRLWRLVEDWHARRPAEMRPIMTIPPSSDDAEPFPAILYSNPAAVSGNQIYHTAALLMLQNRPASLRPWPRPRSALWHARQICGISMTNHHHGAWTNSVQPLWIAGRCMSHPAEHRAILRLLDKIERESGWGTKWRADDLKDFWGDLGDG
ncbi:Transcription activator AMTR1 [Colletotrichum shisoi]|uniref:Transcription activator AMTR1 n=1 Tax=Colletotrichum shisoi TaxID=2078593 RepID=A0A5Q4BLD4_9PEZI|nr:Transcription activator AMTR1 [Colletotrichum shisoi]